MRKLCVALLACVGLAGSATTSAQAVTVFLTGQSGATLTADRASPLNYFTDIAVPNYGTGSTFSLSAYYMADPDTRYGCSGNPNPPAYCTTPSPVYAYGTYTAGTSSKQEQFLYGSRTAGSNAILTLTPTSGGVVRLDIEGYVVSTGITTVAGVPEPASWAMMLAGFGFVGGALRRRQFAASNALSAA